MTIKETNEINLLRDTLLQIQGDVREIRDTQFTIIREVSGVNSRLGIAENEIKTIKIHSQLGHASRPFWVTLIFQTIFSVITIIIALWLGK